MNIIQSIASEQAQKTPLKEDEIMSSATGTKLSAVAFAIGVILLVIGLEFAWLPGLVASLVPAAIGGIVKVATQHRC